MTSNAKPRFAVISNPELEMKEREKQKNYHTVPSWQTDPLREKFMKYVNNEAGRRFTVQDLLRC